MPTARRICRVQELPLGGRKIIDLAGRSIGVFNVDGDFHAIRNACPHQLAPLCLGRLGGTTLPSPPNEFRYGMEGRVIRCPWHGWGFDVTTGRSVFNPHKVRVKSYEVTVECGAPRRRAWSAPTRTTHVLRRSTSAWSRVGWSCTCDHRKPSSTVDQRVSWFRQPRSEKPMPLQLLLLALICIVVAFTASDAHAVPPAQPLRAELAAKNPVDLMPPDPAAAMTFRDRSGSQPPATATWSAGDGAGRILRVETFNESKSLDAVDLRWHVREPLRRGDILLARFFARAEHARQESGEAVFQFAVQQSNPQFARHVLVPLTAGPEWSLIEVPFVAAADADTTQGEIRLSCGAIPQAIQIASLQLLNFQDRAAVSELPQTRFTYRGREDGAAWREASL